MERDAQTDIAIIGYGPVGAALALALSRYGLSVRILERTTAPYALPRAVQIDDEVMRFLRVIGVDEAARARMHVNPGTKFVGPDKRVLIDWSRPMTETPLGWNASYRFHQPDLEGVLRAEISRTPGIAAELGVEVAGLSEDAAGVTIPLADGTTRRARFVVGCDGANSPTRGWIGADWKDLGFRERWLVLDLIENVGAPDFGDHTLQVCDPAQPTTIVRGVRPRRRFEFRIGDEGAEAAKAPEAVWRRLSKWIAPDQAEVERTTVYEFRSTIAAQWRRGRIFLAGDAAHLTPPFMGQGLCAGMRDAANLAWKLAAVAKGADDGLLDTYESERRPHVREYIDMAVTMGRFINQTGREALAGRAAKGEGEAAKLGMIRPALGPGLGARDEVAGRLAPHPRLSGGRRMEDAQRGHVVVLARPGSALTAPGYSIIDDAVLGGWLDVLGAEAVALRPDGYVLGVANSQCDLESLLAAVPAA